MIEREHDAMNFNVAMHLSADFSLIDERKVKSEHFCYFEEDAFESDECLRDDVLHWLSASMEGRWTTFAFYGGETLLFMFEKLEDGVLFKLRW
jgi:hypothetical protein